MEFILCIAKLYLRENFGYIPNSGGVNLANLFDYSTEEKAIGTWVNGKTIYRRVVYTGSLPNTERKTVFDADLKNIDQAITIRGIGKNRNTNEMIPIPYVGDTSSTGMGNNFIKIYLDTVAQVIILTAGDDRTPYDSYAILEYTKKEG